MRGDQQPCRGEGAFQLARANPLRRFDFYIAPTAASRHGSLKDGDLIGRAASEEPTGLAPPASGNQGWDFRLAGGPRQQARDFCVICQEIEPQFDNARSTRGADGSPDLTDCVSRASGRHDSTDAIVSENAWFRDGRLDGAKSQAARSRGAKLKSRDDVGLRTYCFRAVETPDFWCADARRFYHAVSKV
jgi:hypothetical protein